MIKEALQALIDGSRVAGRSFLTGELLETFVHLSQVDPLRWLGVLRAKATVLANGRGGMWGMRRIPDLTTAQLEGLDEPLDQFVCACREVARVAAAAGAAQSERIAQLSQLPPMIAGGLIAVDLLDSGELDQSTAIELLESEVADSDPMPETLALLGRVNEKSGLELIDRWRVALGPPPSAAELEAFDPAEMRFPKNWERGCSWSVALPESVLEPWTDVIEKIQAHWGGPSTVGLMVPKAFGFYHEKQSPIASTSSPAFRRSRPLRRSPPGRPTPVATSARTTTV